MRMRINSDARELVALDHIACLCEGTPVFALPVYIGHKMASMPTLTRQTGTSAIQDAKDLSALQYKCKDLST